MSHSDALTVSAEALDGLEIPEGTPEDGASPADLGNQAVTGAGVGREREDALAYDSVMYASSGAQLHTRLRSPCASLTRRTVGQNLCERVQCAG